MFFNNDEELKQEAREIARRTMQSDDIKGYIEGEAFRVLKLERDLASLKNNFWILVFVIFVLPMILRGAA